MGFIKQAKADALTKEAGRAIAEGRAVFTPRLNTPMTQHGMSGSIAGWAEMIEAVEAQGWQLAEWSVTQDKNGRPEAYPLFRPAGASAGRRSASVVVTGQAAARGRSAAA